MFLRKLILLRIRVEKYHNKYLYKSQNIGYSINRYIDNIMKFLSRTQIVFERRIRVTIIRTQVLPIIPTLQPKTHSRNGTNMYFECK